MANETELERLVVRLVGDGSQYQKMLDSALSQTTAAADQIERATGKIGPAMVAQGTLVAAGVERILDKFREMGSEAIQAYSAHETANIKLNAVLKANGRDVEGVTKEYERFADSVSGVTTAGKVQVEHLLQLAENYGLTGAQAERAAKQALGMEAAFDMNAEGAMRLTSRLAQGSVEMLGRFIPGLDKAGSEADKLALANKRLDATWEVEKALAGTLTGSFANLHKSIHGLYAELGGMIAGALRPLVTGLRSAVDWFRRLDPVVKKATVGVVAFGSAVAAIQVVGMLSKVEAVVTTFKLLGAAIGSLWSPWTLVAGAVVLIGAKIVQSMGGAEKTIEKLEEAMKSLKPILNEINDLLTLFSREIADIGKQIGEIPGVLQFVTSAFRHMRDEALLHLLQIEYGFRVLKKAITKDFWQQIFAGKHLESFEHFRARRMVELFKELGEEAGSNLKAGIDPALKAISKALHPRDAAEFWSAEAMDRARTQLFGLAGATAAVKSAGGARIAAVASGVASPVQQAAAAAARLGGGGLGAVGMRFGPVAFGAGLRQHQVDVRKERDERRDSIFDELDRSPKYAHLTRGQKAHLALKRANAEMVKKHPLPSDQDALDRLPEPDRMPEPSQESIRQYDEGGRSTRIFPRQRPNLGGALPMLLPKPLDILNDEEMRRRQLPNINELPSRPPTGDPTTMLEQIHDVLRQMLDLQRGKKTLEIKPLGLT